MRILKNSDPVQVGERLRLARSRAGLTQQGAAKKLDMARTTLLALEKGQRRIRPEELKSMSAVYGISTNALLRAESVFVNVAPRFRAIAAGNREYEQASVLLNDLAAAQAEIESILGVVFRPNYPPERTIGPGDIREQAEDAALDIRQRLGIGLSPIPDVVTLLELELGVRVFIRPLPSRVSGLFVYDESIGACILLNRNHPRERRALTAAHELGHLITRRSEPDLVELGQAEVSREERFAAEFSYAFLMPAAFIRRRFVELQRVSGRFTPRHLILLAHQLSVSEEALCRRLEELGLLPGGTWDSLKERGFSGVLVRKVLGDATVGGGDSVPPRLWLLAAEAFRRGLLSEGQLVRMLHADRVEVRAMLDDLGAEGDGELDSFEA